MLFDITIMFLSLTVFKREIIFILFTNQRERERERERERKRETERETERETIPHLQAAN